MIRYRRRVWRWCARLHAYIISTVEMPSQGVPRSVRRRCIRKDHASHMRFTDSVTILTLLCFVPFNSHLPILCWLISRNLVRVAGSTACHSKHSTLATPYIARNPLRSSSSLTPLYTFTHPPNTSHLALPSRYADTHTLKSLSANPIFPSRIFILHPLLTSPLMQHSSSILPFTIPMLIIHLPPRLLRFLRPS